MSDDNNQSANGDPPHLAQHHREALKASGLTDSFIDKSRIYTVVKSEVYRALAHLPEAAATRVPAMAFEYPGCPGFVRLRPDSALIPNPEHIEVTAEAPFACDLEPKFVQAGAKYISPLGMEIRLYIRRDLCQDIDNPDAPLWFLEGEKKTLAAIQSGKAAIGAPGVTCWGDAGQRFRSKCSGREIRSLHPDLLTIRLRGRKVIICFDSDIDSNPSVRAAAVALALMLIDAGAEVYIAYLDPAKDGSKQGLDDYLAALPEAKRLGPDPLREVEESARPFNVIDCLDEFLVENWDSYYEWQQKVELARLVQIACHVLHRKADLQKFLKKCSRELQIPLRAVEEQVVEVKKENPTDPRTWVAEWVVRRAVRYEFMRGADRFHQGGREVEQEYLVSQMVLDAATYGGPPRPLIEAAHQVWTIEQREAVLVRLRAGLKHYPALDDSAIRTFVRAVTGKEDAVDVAVVKHFVWQVKRKVNGLPVEHHMMLIVYGRQGAGKSVAIRKLVGPLMAFTDEPGDLTVVGDERQAFRFARAFVMFFDEMAKASRTDMDAFKNRISQPDISWRTLGSNRRETRPNLATFIGASNNAIPDLIIDPTGVRRFYQITCANPIAWDLINEIDYSALWASVNESGAAPIIDVRQELQARQEALRVRDPVEEFVATWCTLGEEWISATEAFESFKEFLKAENVPPMHWGSSKFGRKLKEILGDERWKTSNGMKYQIMPRRVLVEQMDKFEAKWRAANEPMNSNAKKPA